MKQCGICKNKQKCEEHHWAVIMNSDRVFTNGEYVCSNFQTDKEVIILERG